MDQKIVNMIEDCGIEVSDVEHIINAVELQTKSHTINKITDNMLAAFDKKIDSEKAGRTGAYRAAGGMVGNDWHYHEGRVDGVDAGRYIAEKVLVDFEPSPEPLAFPENWYFQLNQPLEEWEIKQELTAERKEFFIRTALTALCECLDNSARYFNAVVELSGYKKDDSETLLNVQLHHHHEQLNDGVIWLYLYIDESNQVYMMVGEDGDQEWELNTHNFWSYAYLNAFCKPQ